MRNPDEEISIIVSQKLEESKKWNDDLIDKISQWIREGNISTNDLIFLLENRQSLKKEVAE